ncbi:hypothetical protein [Ktedonospora formicarum]|uniref:Uncharacterized protein n=1 Tax=Ktedonospora formicarum TaxID=2778364 RepID=A0A8J3MRB1_9CHLR|nr:hypothetical protein [Ktedonospora formicarum]GHO44860.1 hypothetical protein KSX_30230 [Ktedonospora formicarum]
MSSTIHTPPRQAGHALTPPAVTLALWSLRRTWFLLVIIALGLISAMVVACTIPLYSMVTTTAGLRGILNTTVNTSEINLNVAPAAFSTQALRRSQKALDPLVQQHIGPYMSQHPSLMLTSQSIDVLSPRLPAREYDLIQYTATFPQDGKHLQLISGHLPNLKSNEYEIILTPDTLESIGLKVGAKLTLATSIMDTPLLTLANRISSPEALLKQIQLHTFELDIPARVVGTFKVPDTEKAYWHQNDFTELTRDEGAKSIPVYQFLGANELLLNAYDRFTQAHHLDQVYPYTQFDYDAITGILSAGGGSSLPSINWTYRVDPQKMDFSLYDIFSSQVAGLQSDMTRLHGDLLARHDRYYNPFNDFGQSSEQLSLPYTSAMAMTSDLFSGTDGPGALEQYRNRLSVVQLPVAIISAQIIALILFFISMMLGLLVDRQRDTIAVLRSRGPADNRSIPRY